MKKIISILLCVFLIFAIFVGCKSTGKKEYYELNDFKEVVINKTSYSEVCELVSLPEIQMGTSYGFLCEYPMSDGKCICLKFDKDNIVFQIKITESLKNGIVENSKNT